MNTSVQLATAIKQENSNLIWKECVSVPYPYSLPAAGVESIWNF